MADTIDLAGLLSSLGWLDQATAQSVRREAAGEGLPPIVVLRRRGLVSDTVILEALRGHLGLAEVDPESEQTVDLDALRRLSRDLAELHLVLPLGEWHEGGSFRLRVAMADPLHEPSRREVEASSGLGVEPLLADASALERAIASTYDRITTRLIPRPELEAPSVHLQGGHRRRWVGRAENEPETAPSHRMEDEATPLQQMEALRLVLEQKGLVTREEFVEVLKRLLRQGEER